MEIKDNRAEIRKNKETKVTDVCRVCGSKDVHSTYNKPTMECIKHLRGVIADWEQILDHYYLVKK